MANTLTYYDTAKITAVKRLTVPAPEIFLSIWLHSQNISNKHSSLLNLGISDIHTSLLNQSISDKHSSLLNQSISDKHSSLLNQSICDKHSSLLNQSISAIHTSLLRQSSSDKHSSLLRLRDNKNFKTATKSFKVIKLFLYARTTRLECLALISFFKLV
jgi:hypothetical protein